MKLEQIAKELQFELTDYPLLLEHHDAPILKLTSQTPLDFLNEKFIREYASWGKLDERTLEFVLRQARAINEDEPLKCLFALEYFLYNESDIAFTFSPQAEFPQLVEYLGADYGAFFLLLALAAYPRGIKINRERSIPEEIIKDTFADLAVWCEYYQLQRNVTGIDREIVGWLNNHCNGKLLKLGRLQYKFKRGFPDIAHVWRHAENGELKIMASPRLHFNSEGLLDGVNDEFDPDAWTSTLEINRAHIRGHLIAPDGHADREKTAIKREEFIKALSPGDNMLDIHIPATGPMDHESCIESMRMALDFVPRYFPELDFKGFMCISWMLDPHFSAILKPESNIMKLHCLGHLFPGEESGRDGMRRIFGERVFETGLGGIELHSSLQRNTAEFLRSGGKLRSGGIFMLNDELPQDVQING